MGSSEDWYKGSRGGKSRRKKKRRKKQKEREKRRIDVIAQGCGQTLRLGLSNNY